ncbi:MAG TPA: hypothetical protein PKD96_01345 [Candidatus Absconditabacterales bacterium]|nr:hypothetical protein [Candidatus Absconditabacterales bacterium]
MNRSHKTIDLMKRGVLGLGFLMSFGIYVFYVNAASTKGYYLRKESKKLEKIEFDRNILTLDVVQAEKQLRDSIQSSPRKTEFEQINTNIVFVPVTQKLSLNQ